MFVGPQQGKRGVLPLPILGVRATPGPFGELLCCRAADSSEQAVGVSLGCPLRDMKMRAV